MTDWLTCIGMMLIVMALSYFGMQAADREAEMRRQYIEQHVAKMDDETRRITTKR